MQLVGLAAPVSAPNLKGLSSNTAKTCDPRIGKTRRNGVSNRHWEGVRRGGFFTTKTSDLLSVSFLEVLVWVPKREIVVTSATLLGTSALLVVTRSY